MSGMIHAQKLPPPGRFASDAEFHAGFYKPYACAAHTALLMLLAAKRDLQTQTGRDSVRALTFRLKTPASIRGKLRKKGLPLSAHAAGAALSDVAGLRVVLEDEESVYELARLIRQSPIVQCFGEHDYILRPKPSGYRSLHLLLHIPVYTGSCALMVPAEVQLRTVSMDEWASAEHAIVYKPAAQQSC